jgi:ribonuclease HI
MALDPRAPSRVRMPRCRICSAPMPAPRTAYCRLCAEIAHCSGVMIAYVDGSYFPQTRSAGAAAVILADDGSSRVVSGCVEASSSIEAEASAALLAVNTLESHEADSMVIFTDSLVLVRAMRSPSTPAVFRELRQTVYGRRVDWRFLPRGRRHPEHLAAHHEARRVASLSVVAPHRSSWTRTRRLQSPESLFVVVAPYWSPERARAACCIAVADSCGVRCFVQPLSCSNRAEEENAAISSAIAMLPGPGTGYPLHAWRETSPAFCGRAPAPRADLAAAVQNPLRQPLQEPRATDQTAGAVLRGRPRHLTPSIWLCRGVNP